MTDTSPGSNPNTIPNPNPDPQPQPNRVKTDRGAICIEREKPPIADVDSELQTALRRFQVKNTPIDPFSQIAKLTQSVSG